jgi:hypothetical protein
LKPDGSHDDLFASESATKLEGLAVDSQSGAIWVVAHEPDKAMLYLSQLALDGFKAGNKTYLDIAKIYDFKHNPRLKLPGINMQMTSLYERGMMLVDGNVLLAGNPDVTLTYVFNIPMPKGN